MSDFDELEELRIADPLRGGSVPRSEGPQRRARAEEILMSIDTTTHTAATETSTDPGVASTPVTDLAERRNRGSRLGPWLAGAATAAALVGAGFLISDGDDAELLSAGGPTESLAYSMTIDSPGADASQMTGLTTISRDADGDLSNLRILTGGELPTGETQRFEFRLVDGTQYWGDNSGMEQVSDAEGVGWRYADTFGLDATSLGFLSYPANVPLRIDSSERLEQFGLADLLEVSNVDGVRTLEGPMTLSIGDTSELPLLGWIVNERAMQGLEPMTEAETLPEVPATVTVIISNDEIDSISVMADGDPGPFVVQFPELDRVQIVEPEVTAVAVELAGEDPTDRERFTDMLTSAAVLAEIDRRDIPANCRPLASAFIASNSLVTCLENEGADDIAEVVDTQVQPIADALGDDFTPETVDELVQTLQGFGLGGIMGVASSAADTLPSESEPQLEQTGDTELVEDTEAIIIVPIQPTDEGHDDALFTGTLESSNGCAVLVNPEGDSSVIRWRFGTEQTSPTQITMADGTPVNLGETISIGGGEASAEQARTTNNAELNECLDRTGAATVLFN